MSENDCENCMHYRHEDHPEYSPPLVPGGSSFGQSYCENGNPLDAVDDDCEDFERLSED